MSNEHSGKISKPEQALTLDPACELHFKGPYNEVTTSYLLLTNPTDKLIGFKVKTTAPKTYCVRPNGGVIQPRKTVSVAVMLQPFDHVSDDRSKDKFMVQSVFLPEGETTYYDAVWQDVPSEAIMNSKLKCVFDIPTADPPAAAVTAPEQVVAAPTPPEIVEKPKPVKVKVSEVQEVQVTSDYEVELQTTSDERKKLKTELNELRAENSALKEEGLRLRRTQDTINKGKMARPESDRVDSYSQSAAVDKQQSQLRNYFIPIAILIFFLGLFIGKVAL